MIPQNILISIPHGGLEVPPELRSHVILGIRDIFQDIDAYTLDIYNPGRSGFHQVKTATARPFIDLNRAPDDLPPRHTDGVIKSHTCWGVRVYKEGFFPNPALRDILLEKYYYPYHRQLEKKLKQPGVSLLLDCHSMAAAAPITDPAPGSPRPLFCLSNGPGTTCPDSLLTRFAGCLAEAFGIDPIEVSLNVPFQGGYITRKYGGAQIHSIQIEINRSWYLSPPWFDTNTLKVDPLRLRQLNKMFIRSIHRFMSPNFESEEISNESGYYLQ